MDAVNVSPIIEIFLRSTIPRRYQDSCVKLFFKSSLFDFRSDIGRWPKALVSA
jgi:hypothetical protein